ncbi:MAG: alpha-glucosidase C-terminal domain-containing protein [Caldilineaceae bacterium]|nr:alpha-glucosidase C-terminal domain-containing protein [Caldilineaceae bacterium]
MTTISSPIPAHAATRTLERIRPWLAHEFADQLTTPAWQQFDRRLTDHFEQLFRLLVGLYGNHYDFFYHLTQIVALAARSWLARSPELQALDAEREANPTWHQSQTMLGGVCYVDLFAGDLQKLREKIDYFQELGLTYLHLMPLFKAPEGDSDGGYAVSDYRAVDARLGTMEDLRQLATELRHAGISLVLDFVFNHTSDEHRWATAALAGNPDYQEYYFFFPDRTLPDAYDRTLREIFPDQHPGSFTYREESGQWVWSTFNSFQWDLNYSNPMVFTEMAGEMLFLANVGCEVLRLDALAFIWKRLGTDCENLPEAHQLVQAFNALLRIAAPTLLFKSEAIVHPDEVAKYIGEKECQLSYNPLLMALLWNSLATREVRLLRHAMSYRFKIPAQTSWVNYIRCHDDIGWTFDDGDANALGINGYDHRRFLNAFYTGRFPGSFARGLPFQENPKTGDARISGTLASLAGLERALQINDPDEIELAIRRILMLHAIILSIGGIPLLYLGDEVGWCNDYSYRNDPAKAEDSRWVHRPPIHAEKLERRHDPEQVEGEIYRRLHRLITLRRETAGFGGNQMEVIPIGSDHIFGFVRTHAEQRILVVANFTEKKQFVQANELRLYGLGYHFCELITGEQVSINEEALQLAPYQVMWLETVSSA